MLENKEAKWAVYKSGGVFNNKGSLAYMRQDDYDHWAEVSQEAPDWPMLKEKYAVVARDLTLVQAEGMLKLLHED